MACESTSAQLLFLLPLLNLRSDLYENQNTHTHIREFIHINACYIFISWKSTVPCIHTLTRLLEVNLHFSRIPSSLTPDHTHTDREMDCSIISIVYLTLPKFILITHFLSFIDSLTLLRFVYTTPDIYKRKSRSRNQVFTTV